MGVVRREGDWRLEKVEEGAYEITFDHEPQLKVITPDHHEQFGSVDMLPVREVDSYAEAEGLFEEKAHGPDPFGGGGGGLFDDTSDGGLLDGTSDGGGGFLDSSSTGGGGLLSGEQSTSSSGDENDLEDIDAPPGVIGLAFIIVGLLVVYNEGFAPNSIIFKAGIGFAAIGLAVFGWGGYLYRSYGLEQASRFLFHTGDGKSTSGSTDPTEKTPPAPKDLKEELKFNRANHHCEWCGDRFDGLHVHHIEPRKEGGPNTRRNLIALCPNCHDRADRGALTKSQLKGKVRQIMAE